MNFEDLLGLRKKGVKRIEDMVIDPRTNEFIVQDPTRQEMLQGAQKFGPNLGARPDMDITPWLKPQVDATGRYIEPERNPGLNMLIEELFPRSMTQPIAAAPEQLKKEGPYRPPEETTEQMMNREYWERQAQLQEQERQRRLYEKAKKLKRNTI